MSSLAAARADNFYYPPGFDPSKGEGLNKLHGTHALGKRANRLKSEGVLIIRFEMPFNVWCTKCGDMIGKGVRFNAEKRLVGNYLSTKIWSFCMRHHCGSKIEIHTDPKNTEYVLVEGARRKVEGYSAGDAEVIDLSNAEQNSREFLDPLKKAEHRELNRKKAKLEHVSLAKLREEKQFNAINDSSINRMLRGKLRTEKKEIKSRDDRRKELGLPEHIPLLPESEADKSLASKIPFGRFPKDSPKKDSKSKRHSILKSSIFSKQKSRRKHSSAKPTTNYTTDCTASCSALDNAAGKSEREKKKKSVMEKAKMAAIRRGAGSHVRLGVRQ